jgi:hypothetical protein
VHEEPLSQAVGFCARGDASRRGAEVLTSEGRKA